MTNLCARKHSAFENTIMGIWSSCHINLLLRWSLPHSHLWSLLLAVEILKEDRFSRGSSCLGPLKSILRATSFSLVMFLKHLNLVVDFFPVPWCKHIKILIKNKDYLNIKANYFANYLNKKLFEKLTSNIGIIS